ncbi:hypothetical protein OsI_29485 [Oryza sativa Indica Group]|uniref:Uncharacterized protein n=1 Tax=Oryza sativa subsp. indica TaxID=39946 RepID=B8BBB3_ORYSI|nr:hypothetical protein OsI_29485 [Oryza sativa Indica Group]
MVSSRVEGLRGGRSAGGLPTVERGGRRVATSRGSGAAGRRAASPRWRAEVGGLSPYDGARRMAGGLPTAARGGRSMGGHIEGHRLPTAVCDGELPTVARREASGRSAGGL